MVIDIIFAILAAYGFYLGFSRGIIQTIFTILSILFGLMAAFKFGPYMTQFLETAFNNDHPLMFIAGFLLAFVLTMFLIRLFARGLEGLLERANINIVNQVAGGLLLSGLMILLYSVILWFGDKSHLIDDATKRQSLTYVYLEEFPQEVWKLGRVIKPVFEDFWEHSVEFMDDLEELSNDGVERSESEEDFDIEEE